MIEFLQHGGINEPMENLVSGTWADAKHDGIIELRLTDADFILVTDLLSAVSSELVHIVRNKARY